uniref:Putative secreted peptide n=1 Tax=Anopheles braziliensis TaxID=58242 RepID=A0A2M3ZQT9_9DIPT
MVVVLDILMLAHFIRSFGKGQWNGAIYANSLGSSVVPCTRQTVDSLHRASPFAPNPCVPNKTITKQLKQNKRFFFQDF